MTSTTVDLHTIDADGQHQHVLHAETISIRAALRLVNRNAPACVNPHVCRRIHAEQGGRFQIGSLIADIGVCA